MFIYVEVNLKVPINILIDANMNVNMNIDLSAYVHHTSLRANAHCLIPLIFIKPEIRPLRCDRRGCQPSSAWEYPRSPDNISSCPLYRCFLFSKCLDGRKLNWIYSVRAGQHLRSGYVGDTGIFKGRPSSHTHFWRLERLLQRCEEGRHKATWKRGFKLPWREGGPSKTVVDPDQ